MNRSSSNRMYLLAATLLLLGAGCSQNKIVSVSPDTGSPAPSLPAPVIVGSATANNPSPTPSPADPKKDFPRYKEIVNPAGYVNADKITIGELIGKKVVLVDFLTYTCINCIRTFPYLNAWYDKYKDQGLEIVGIHTPEFAFEKNRDNVAAAMKQYGINFPIVLDNDYGTWRAYGNNFWPRKYLIDIDGAIVYDHIGEGEYEETELRIQAALKERRMRLGEQKAMPTDMVQPTNVETLDTSAIGSPETYFGSARNEYLGNGIPGKAGVQKLATPSELKSNTLYLVGEWDIHDEFAGNLGLARIIYKYRAKRLHFVASSEAGVTVKVLLDGKPLGAIAGVDVKNGMVNIQADRLYELVNDQNSTGEHMIEIQIDKPGLKAFTFTFG